MKKAFTLIELLVVIAIIAILAAILFPVFAQAKAAAKKSVSISNQKQISLGILLYTGDNDDLYPRNDDCVANSSLNPRLNLNDFPANGIGPGCTSAPFKYRLNAFAWQKWVLPYIKNVDIFDHPMRQKDSTNWNNNGQIVGGFALNTSVTGQLDTYNRSATFARQIRNSWLGGSTTSVPSPSETLILLEIPNAGVPMVPGGSVDSQGVGPTVTIYPPAIREFWRYKLMRGTVADCIAGTSGLEPDAAKIASGGVTVGFTDGSARFLTAQNFLSRTPTKLEYLGVSGSHTAGWTFQDDCRFLTSGNLGFVQPNLNINYPMWGLVAQ
ncbi:MAG: prepilin-type N-terminal cleavage/methylation domain-containing protein [Fimbriimonadaceae bacterium]|nr:prepilin-type N-terminal cleavage/methylation domain-containing protein [Fimbriimonadaceae bacterium]